MTNEELIATIRNEIERQMKFYNEKEMKAWDGSERGDEDALWYQGHRKMCAKLLSFLSTLEPEKPMNQDELKKEIENQLAIFPYTKVSPELPESRLNVIRKELYMFARHFAKWGAENLKK